MTIQIINIFEKYLFKRYGKKYGIFHELYETDQIALEIRNIEYETALLLKKFFLDKGELTYLKEKDNGNNFDFLVLGSPSSLREIVAESSFPEEEDLQIAIQKKLRNYSGNNNIALNLLTNLGIESESPLCMNILNVTPDSFSDGGKYSDREEALKHAIEMLDEGADIIDVGGVSTRPGASAVPTETELKRVMPVIEDLLKERPEAVVSVDTTNSVVAEKALNLGVKIINDISGGTFDDKIFDVVASFDATMVLMHIKGTPQNMQKNPFYEDAVNEIYESLEKKIETAQKKGVRKIIIDPGIGFGKRLMDNYEIISRLKEFKSLGYPLLIGVSRKSMLGNALNIGVDKRDVPTVIAESVAVSNGADIVRTHNVVYFNYLKKINYFFNNPFVLEND